MSMHKLPMTEVEREGLLHNNLSIDKPSQLSDAFRLGIKWAEEKNREKQRKDINADRM
jgi:hypothetical protein